MPDEKKNPPATGRVRVAEGFVPSAIEKKPASGADEGRGYVPQSLDRVPRPTSEAGGASSSEGDGGNAQGGDSS